MKKTILLFISIISSVLLFATAPTTITVPSTAGGLSAAITAAGGDLTTVTDLTVTGTIDARDYVTMRDAMTQLAVLDLSGVTIAAYTGTATNGSRTYPANEIPQYAFCTTSSVGKTSLKSIVMPASINSIGDFAFGSCSGFTCSLTIPSSITSIGLAAFMGCSGFTGSLIIPSSVTSIAQSAFDACTGFTGALTIPSSVISIGNNAFTSYNGLITVDMANLNYSSIDGVLFNKDKTILMQCPTSKTGSYTIPSSVTSIGVYAFFRCKSFTGSLTIPSSVTSIGYAAFYACSGFTGSLVLPSSVTSIGAIAFDGCRSFTGSLTIPSSVTSIGEAAFYDCSGFTGSLTIPSSITSIGYEAFQGCSNLSSIKAYYSTPGLITLGTTVFSGISTSACLLNVPVGTKGLYEAADQWKNFTNKTDELIVPTLSTQAVTTEGLTTAIGNGTISGLGETNPTQYGMVWSTATNPTVALSSKTTQGTISTVGTFTSDITGLTANTKYYLKTYVTNTTGTYYGDELTFTTLTNSSPSDLALSVNAINENVAANSPVGTFSSTDPDTGDTFTYTLVTGTGSNDNTFFNISGSSLRITNSPDYETKNSYTVRVRNTDQGGLFFEKAFTISINNLPEAIPAMTIHVATAGGLSAAITAAGGTLSGVTNLTVTGTIDARDFVTMRDNMPLLAILDLSGATIAAYSGTDGTDTYAWYGTIYPANTMPREAFEFENVSGTGGHGKLSLTSVILPSTITTIDYDAFFGCSNLSSITIPSTVTSIESWAFYGCQSITSIDCQSSIPPSCSTAVFSGIDVTTCILYVPVGSARLYAAIYPYNKFTHIEIVNNFWLSASTSIVAKEVNSSNTIKVNSTITWTASSDQAWLSVSPDIATNGDAVLTLTTTQALPTTASRTATVTVSASGVASQTITVTQQFLIYCIPVPSMDPNTMWIENISTSGGISNFNNTSSQKLSSYADYSGSYNASNILSGTTTMTFTSHFYFMSFSTWIDFNDNGSFEASEKVISNSNTGRKLTVTDNFTVPVTAPLGIHRMRVRGDYSGSSQPNNPCDPLQYGETEDYAFTVCAIAPTITTQSVSDISSTEATLNANVNANFYSTNVSFEYGTTTSYGTSATAVQSPVTGISATAVSYTLSGLMPNTTYHYRVNGVNSVGTTNGGDISFTTTDIAPNISYVTPQTFTVGVPIADLTPTNTGGPVLAVSSPWVSTFAGSGSIGSTDGLGTAASFSAPIFLAPDVAGNIYVSDFYNNMIRKITPDGNVSTFADDAAGVNSPLGIVVDRTGNVYIADNVNYRIIKITSAGVVSTLAGSDSGESGNTNGVGTAARFSNPFGLALDAAGNLYVTELESNLIRKITPAGDVSTFAGNGASGSADGNGSLASFNQPAGIVIDASGNLYVTDSKTNLIRKISSSGDVTTLAGSGAKGSTNGNGTLTSFNSPIGIAIDASGNLYVADSENNLIRKINPVGDVTTFAGNLVRGSNNGAGETARFTMPYGVTVDATGNLYIADTFGNLIRKITQSSYTISSALPAGLSLDGATGVISGTPTAASPAATYLVTTGNSGGSSSANISITVKNPQTITFNALPTNTYGDAPYNLTATTTSGLALSYASDNTAVATVSGNTVTIVGAGNANIIASQAGDATYVAADNVIQQLIVNKKTLSVTATGDTKIYDGTTVSNEIPTVDPQAIGDEINVAPTQAFDYAMAGTTHVITATGLTIKNGSTNVTGNYNIQYVAANGSITAKSLTIGAPNVAPNKVYDGNNESTVSVGVLSGVVVSDAGNVNVSALASYDNASVGTNKTITIAYTLRGNAISNYTLTQPGVLLANITAKELTVTGATSQSKVYDGTTTAAITGATLTGVVGSDNVVLATATTGMFAKAGTGTDISVTPSMTITGSAIGNYTLTQPNGLKANITAKELTVTGATAQSKVYDGTTTAAITGATLSGVVESDNVVLATATTGILAKAGTGTDISVTPAMTITGSAIGNYTLTQPTGLKANITTKVLTVTGATAQSKVYDGTTTAAVILGTLSGVITNDAAKVTLGTTASYLDAKAGTAKTITVKYSLSGTAAGNYTAPVDYNLAKSDITRKQLTISDPTVVTSKMVDGNNTAAITTVGTLQRVETVDANNVTVTAAASYIDANVGAGKTITVVYALSGSAKDNYITPGSGILGSYRNSNAI